jgi:hypothetical protein
MLLAWEMSSGRNMHPTAWQWALLAVVYLALVAVYLRFVSKAAFKSRTRRVAASLSLCGFVAGVGVMLWIFVLPELLRW